MRTITALALAALTVTALGADPVQITGTNVRFTVTKLGFADVTGHFRQFTADIRYDPAQPERSAVHWRVRVGSVDTGERDRDSALQSAEYFAATQYPELTFTSRSVRGTAGRLEVTGDLSMRGVTKTVTIPVTVSAEGGRRRFVSDFEVDRYDFNVRGGSVMSRLIGRTVRVHLEAMEGAGA